jgi:tetratricopeptide (TPR) repeat protein
MWVGLCLLYLDRHEEALRELKASLARNPRAFPAYYILGIIYFELGRMDEARAAVKESLRLNPRLSISNLKRFVPYKNPSDVERQLSALRKLGFPE